MIYSTMENPHQIIADLKKEIKKLRKKINELESIKIPEDLSNTFFVIDQYGKLALVYGLPPKGYISPVVKTKVTFKKFRRGDYDQKTLKEFRFPLTGNIIFRGGYVIDPKSFEGKIITKIIKRQRQDLIDNQKQKTRVKEIHSMNFKQITEYLDEMIKVAKKNKSKNAARSKGKPQKRTGVGPND